MPGPTLPNMTLVLPAIDGDSGLWDDELNTALTLVDGHDHSPGKGLRIKTAAIQIDAALNLAGFGAVNVGEVALAEIATPAAGARLLYVDTNDHELYWRSNAGVNVKLTSGVTLNTSLIGGIGGDYTAVGAEVDYVDADHAYTFKRNGAPKPWARISCGDVRLHETDTVESVYVGLKAPAALAASFDVTLPLTLPVSTLLVQMDAAGVLTTSNTITQPITLSGGVVGTTSFTVEIDVPTVVASANYKHSYVKSRLVCAALARINNGATLTFNAATLGWNLNTSSGAERLIYPLPVEFGDRITAWRLQVNNQSVGGTVTARLYKKVTGPLAEVETALGTASTTSALGTFATLGNVGLSIDCGDQIYEQYYLVVTGGGFAGDLAYNATVDVKRV